MVAEHTAGTMTAMLSSLRCTMMNTTLKWRHEHIAKQQRRILPVVTNHLHANCSVSRLALHASYSNAPHEISGYTGCIPCSRVGTVGGPGQHLIKEVQARLEAVLLEPLLPELLAQVAALLWLHIVCAEALRPAWVSQAWHLSTATTLLCTWPWL